MADKKISELPAAGPLGGSELVPVVQGGSTMKATVAGIAPIRSADDVSDAVVVVGSVSTNYAIPLDAAAVYKLTLTANVTLSATGMSAARSRAVQVRVTASGARTLAFSSAWRWAGAKPTALASGAQGLLFLTFDGDAEADVVASWQALGDGS